MNFAQIMGLLRLILGIGGATALTAAGFDGNGIAHAVQGATTPGGLLLGVAPIVAAGAWSLYAHTAAATVDRAVKMAPQLAADKAASIGVQASTAEGGTPPRMKPTGLSRMVDK